MDNHEQYHILNVLNIYYNETEHYTLVLDKRSAYFYYCCDEDEIFYEQSLAEERKHQLTVRKNPIVIYKNSQFSKSLCETKYKDLVEKLIHEHGKSWEDITKIVKVERKIENEQLTFANGRFQIHL
jgi:hypothetical protein